MATYLQLLSFKSSLPWYKRIVFPIWLNKKETERFNYLMNDEYTIADSLRDEYLACWSYCNKNRDKLSLCSIQNYEEHMNFLRFVIKRQDMIDSSLYNEATEA